MFNGSYAPQCTFGNTQIAVKPPIGKPFFVKLRINNTFLDLKNIICSLKGVQPINQTICIYGQKMEDDSLVFGCAQYYDMPLTLIYQQQNPINLTIKTVDGDTLSLTADKTNLIEDIKYEAFYQFDFNFAIPLSENDSLLDSSILTFSGILLNDSRTLNDYLISNSETFYYTMLKPREIIIFIKYSDEYIPLNFSPTDNISSIKSKICDLLQIDLSSQILLFEGKQLQDQDRILDYSIYSEATIELKTAQNSDETDISSQNESNTNSKVTVYVQILSESKVQIECDPCEDVRSFKKLVEAETGIRVKNQKLLFGGKQLSDEYRLDKYTITGGSVILLIPFEEESVNVTAYLLHEDYHTLVSLETKPTCFIKDFKKKIFERTGIPVDKQALILNNEILSGDLSLQAYGIGTDVCIEVVHLKRGGKIIFFKQSDDDNIPIEVKDDDSVEYVTNILSVKRGIPSEQIAILAEPFRELANGQEVWFCIKLPGTIHVFVHFQHLQKTEVFYIHPDDRIEDVKEIIFKRKKIPADQQRLIYAGRQLEDGNFIKDYDIPENAKFTLVLRLRG